MLFETIVNVDVPEIRGHGREWSDDFKSFVKLCLKRDPNERATVNDLLKSKFLIDIVSDEAKREACK